MTGPLKYLRLPAAVRRSRASGPSDFTRTPRGTTTRASTCVSGVPVSSEQATTRAIVERTAAIEAVVRWFMTELLLESLGSTRRQEDGAQPRSCEVPRVRTQGLTARSECGVLGR